MNIETSIRLDQKTMANLTACGQPHTLIGIQRFIDSIESKTLALLIFLLKSTISSFVIRFFVRQRVHKHITPIENRDGICPAYLPIAILNVSCLFCYRNEKFSFRQNQKCHKISNQVIFVNIYIELRTLQWPHRMEFVASSFKTKFPIPMENGFCHWLILSLNFQIQNRNNENKYALVMSISPCRCHGASICSIPLSKITFI